MAKKSDNKSSTASLNGESDLEGKAIVDSTGAEVGVCKAVTIGNDGKIGLTIEVEINGKKVTPTQTIPYSAIHKITDIIELKVPINIRVAQSAAEVKKESEKSKKAATQVTKKKTEGKREEKTKADKKSKEKTPPETEKPAKESEKETAVTSTKTIPEEGKTLTVPKKAIEEQVKEEKEDSQDQQQEKKAEVLAPKEIAPGKPEDPRQVDATEQLMKSVSSSQEKKQATAGTKSKESPTVIEDSGKAIPPEESKKATEPTSQQAPVETLVKDLQQEIGKLNQLFQLLEAKENETKIEAIEGLTALTILTPELGLSLIPKMMKLNDESQQDVRLAIAKQLEIIAETNPELLGNYFLELFENAFEEPIEEIREQLTKALHETAMSIPEETSNGLEKFLTDVISGKLVPEVPAKVLHDVTLKVVSGSFFLARSAIRPRLFFISKGSGKLGSRCAEELEDYNATLIGLTIVEEYSPKEAEKLIKKSIFKKLGPIFLDVINKIIEAYKEGSFEKLESVVDKKIEISPTVIERFFEIKIIETLKGVQIVPMDVFLENNLVSSEEAEQIVYRLVVQKRVNAAVSINKGKTFISSLEEEQTPKKKNSKQSSKSTKKSTTKRKTSTSKKSTAKKSSSSKNSKANSKKKTTPSKKSAAKEPGTNSTTKKKKTTNDTTKKSKSKKSTTTKTTEEKTSAESQPEKKADDSPTES